ncbi:hypothetical protein AB0I39_07115 [Kitasatospora purpeofusca]|uniref:hypothetical protein n=1 Tax=Kitasatospora purpeofusca TaxID=67352 RepID=UPI0033C1EAC9
MIAETAVAPANGPGRLAACNAVYLPPRRVPSVTTAKDCPVPELWITIKLEPNGGVVGKGIPEGAVDAAVLANDGGDDVHLAVESADRGPPAAVGIAFGGEPGCGDQAPCDVGPLGVGQVLVARIGAHRAHPHGPLR